MTCQHASAVTFQTVYSNDKIHLCLHTKQPSNQQTRHMISTSVSCDLVLQTMSTCVCLSVPKHAKPLQSLSQSGPPCRGKGQMEIMCSFPLPPRHQESSLSPWTLLVYDRSFKLLQTLDCGFWSQGRSTSYRILTNIFCSSYEVSHLLPFSQLNGKSKVCNFNVQRTFSVEQNVFRLGGEGGRERGIDER